MAFSAFHFPQYFPTIHLRPHAFSPAIFLFTISQGVYYEVEAPSLWKPPPALLYKLSINQPTNQPTDRPTNHASQCVCVCDGA